MKNSASTSNQMRLFAVAPAGVEAVTTREIENIGGKNIIPDSGGVGFDGDTAILYRANLHLRTAERVLNVMKVFSASTAPMLYDQVRRIKWEELLDNKMTISVHATLSMTDDYRGEIRHSGFAALKIKDAIVDRMRYTTGSRPDVDTENPDLKIHAFFRDAKCTLSLDSSGRALHERDYRKASTEAQLKETLAAALVLLSGWDRKVPLVDPMCGSGTIAIEAAMIAVNSPPAKNRRDFGFMRWRDFNRPVWESVLKDSGNVPLPSKGKYIYAFDSNQKAVDAALKNARAAGVEHLINFACVPVEKLQPPCVENGLIITNPPYGFKSAPDEDMGAFYKNFGDILKNRMKGWTAFIFTGNLKAMKHVGLRTTSRHILFNGPIECRLLRYNLY